MSVSSINISSTLITLLNELHIHHISGTEEEILQGINECNGDGDDYNMIGEIIEDKLTVLVG